ncbi:MAG: HD domain-containing protein [Bacteroidetes bacterium]|nr:HD domain-containing protein [Bacteroidota bacterium]
MNNSQKIDCLEIPIFKIISEVAKSQGIKAYVIGGYVRDYFLERKNTDIDIMVVGSGIAIAEAIGKKLDTKVSVFKSFGTAMLRYKNMEIEFVGARKESYNRNSRKPVVENGTLEDDQNRRDFTINAMAFSLNDDNFGELLDPFDGIGDLDKKIIQTPLDADITFSDDPLRMIRAIRFATQLNFTITDSCKEAIKRNAHRLEIVSMERIITELNKIMLSKKPSTGFYLLDECELLPIFFKELGELKDVDVKNGRAHKDNFIHTLQVLDNIAKGSDDLWLRWAGLLHDIGKPRTKSWEEKVGWAFHGHEIVGSRMIYPIFKKLKLPLSAQMKYVKKLVSLHLRPIAISNEIVTDSAIRRLLFEAGDDVDDLMLLCEADITSKNDAKVNRYKRNFQVVREKMKEIEEKDRIRNFQPPINGDIITKRFNIPPSNLIGEIKKIIKDAILDGVIENDYDQAYELMEKIGKDKGLI